MKENELQIGDWVQIVEPYKYAGAIGRIKTLIDHKDDENAYFKVFLRNNPIHIGIEDICSNDIRPIPLTPEILEKNFPIANGCQYIDDNNDVCIEVYFNATTEKYKKYAILYTNMGKIYIDKYVHQLQHALRLCGIKKEIEL